MTSSPRTDTRAELFRALGVLAEPPGAEHGRLADLLRLPEPDGTDWTEAFVVQLVPYASVYLGADGMLGGAAADRVAGFWRALRMSPPADPDHLASMLGLYAALVDAEHAEPEPPRRALRRQARAALLHEHLLCWLLPYLHAMVDVGPPPYAAWAALLRELLVGEAADADPPANLPRHLMDLPRPSGNPASLDELVDGLLSPARSGIVLTRGHLGAAARELGLGSRLGERRRVLRALIEQDAPGMLCWLSEQARSWASRHRADEVAMGAAARHWAERASTTAGQLREYMTQANQEARP